MTHVLTLIASPRTRSLDGGVCGAIAALLPDPRPSQWLADHIAVDIPFTPGKDADLPAIETRCREHLGDAKIDLAIQPGGDRVKRLLIADMDSTIIEQECIDELGAAIGLRDKIAAITERAMRGELEFEGALIERAGYLRDLPVARIDQILEHRITIMPGAQTLVKTMRRAGAFTALVSGGFTRFVEPVAQRTGFEFSQANTLIVEGGKLTGGVQKPILGRDAKARALVDLCRAHGLKPSQALAVGDGANDLAMLELAGLGVAFRAKPAVAGAARVRVDHGDLTALLYLQGFKASQFED